MLFKPIKIIFCLLFLTLVSYFFRDPVRTTFIEFNDNHSLLNSDKSQINNKQLNLNNRDKHNNTGQVLNRNVNREYEISNNWSYWEESAGEVEYRPFHGIGINDEMITDSDIANDRQLTKEILGRCFLYAFNDVDALLIHIATIYYNNNNIDGFNDIYSEIAKEITVDTNAHENLANFYAEKGELEKSISILQMGVDINPDNINIRSALADYLELQGKYQEAFDQYEILLALNSNDPSIYIKLSQIYEEIGDTYLANSALEVASTLLQETEL